MWIEKDNALFKEYNFRDFKQAFLFMTLVADLAEELNHHPDWSNCWNVVRIKLSTHDAGNIVTALDRQLAIKIDEAYSKIAPIQS